MGCTDSDDCDTCSEGLASTNTKFVLHVYYQDSDTANYPHRLSLYHTPHATALVATRRRQTLHGAATSWGG